jgi:flagellar hook-basal body complex protein FliE
MYTPKINPFTNTSNVAFKGAMSFPDTSRGISALDAPQKTSFKDVMGNLIKDTDNTLTKPDELMNRALTTGDVDIHEVMIANTKADMAINIVSQVATKVIQAYERVQQIQV